MMNAKAPDTIEERVAIALKEYQDDYYSKASNVKTDAAESAKRVVEEAIKFVRDSGIAYSMCRGLLDQMMYWPSRSKRDDFHEYCKPPFQHLSSSSFKEGRGETKIVNFTYKGAPFKLKFFDQGYFFSSPERYGKLELIEAGETVIGLDIYLDLSKEFPQWWFTSVFALKPGAWMKTVVEIAAHLDAENTKRSEDARNSDAVARASRITLPEA